MTTPPTFWGSVTLSVILIGQNFSGQNFRQQTKFVHSLAAKKIFKRIVHIFKGNAVFGLWWAKYCLVGIIHIFHISYLISKLPRFLIFKMDFYPSCTRFQISQSNFNIFLKTTDSHLGHYDVITICWIRCLFDLRPSL